MSVTFTEFYKNFGFDEYPFSMFTAEHEQKRGKELFVDFSIYGPIIEGFANGRTMILSGDRGTGKTAVIYDFCRKAPSTTLVINISDYSELPTGFELPEFYKFVVGQVSEKLFSKIAEDRISGRSLSRDDKITLSFFLANFVKQKTKADLDRKLAALQTNYSVVVAKAVYKLLKVPLNIGANACVDFLSGLISQSLGTPKHPPEWREYFADPKSSVETQFNTPDYTYDLLKKVVHIAGKVGYSKVLIILDKVDEDARLENAAEEIENFIQKVATDNKFLTDDDFQVVLSIWVIPFNGLKDKVRTQKLFCPQLTWSNSDLISAADRRIQVFSNNKIKSLGQMFAEGETTIGFDELLTLANKNPRDFWHLLDKGFRAQYDLDKTAKAISAEAIKKGVNEFVCGFNFYEYYPRKSNARANSMDVYAYIKHLSRLDNVEFTRNQLNERAGTGSSTQNYVSAMENIGLVERSGTQGGSTTFRIRDPKVVHALKHQLEISRNA